MVSTVATDSAPSVAAVHQLTFPLTQSTPRIGSTSNTLSVRAKMPNSSKMSPGNNDFFSNIRNTPLIVISSARPSLMVDRPMLISGGVSMTRSENKKLSVQVNSSQPANK